MLYEVITIAERQAGDPFMYLDRQLLSAGLGLIAAVAMLAVPVSAWERAAPLLLAAKAVITSYSIHYTKLYEFTSAGDDPIMPDSSPVAEQNVPTRCARRMQRPPPAAPLSRTA